MAQTIQMLIDHPVFSFLAAVWSIFIVDIIFTSISRIGKRG